MSKPKSIGVTEARAYLRDLVDDVQKSKERVHITRYGKVLACLVPLEDVEIIERCKRELAERWKREPGAGGRGRGKQA